MKTTVRKRSILIGGHKTSVSLEDAFWNALKDLARQNRGAVSGMAAQIDKTRERHNLSSAIRVFVLDHYRTKAQSSSQDRAAA
jgi:predicted DNA-binding ribbon-helix-helix protein